MHNKIKFFGIILTAAVCINCSGNRGNDDQTAIVCMDQKISAADFRLLYELDPAFPAYKKGPQGLQEFAEKTAAKILAAKRAETEGVFEQSSAKNAVEYQRKKAVIHSFYTDEIAEKITVSEDELKSIFVKMSARLELKQIFFEGKPDAVYYHKLLKKGVPFDSLAVQVYKEGTGKSVKLGLVSWGQLDETLQETAWSLKTGGFSEPVQSKWGYHILCVTARHDLYVPSNDEFVRRRQSIYKKVKRKKEEKAASVYLKDYLTPYEIKVKRDPFLKLAGALDINIETGRHSGKSLGNQPALQPMTNAQIERIEQSFKKDLNAVFMTSTRENWTIRQFLDNVKKIPVYKRPAVNTLKKFKDDIGTVIRNEFLHKQALGEGHGNNAIVDSSVSVFKQETAYQHYLRQYFLEIEVPENVAEYFTGINDSSGAILARPESILDGMIESRQYKAYYAAQKLHSDLFEKYAQEIIIFNTAFIKEEAKRINWDNPVRMFVPEKF